MTDVLQLGPLVFAADRAIAAVAIVAFLGAARWWRGIERADAQNTATLAVAVGAIAARAAHVALEFPSFAADPLSALYVWQGGFFPAAGVAAAAVVVLLVWGTTRRAVAPLVTLAVVAVVAGSSLALLERRAVQPLPRGLVALSADGVPVALDEYRGRPLVVNLWATWCPPCRREMPRLVDAARRYPAIPLLLVNQGEEPDAVAAYLLAERLAATRVLLDPESTVGRALGSAALPTTLFVDAAGTIRRRHYGEISRAGLEAGLREIGAATAP